MYLLDVTVPLKYTKVITGVTHNNNYITVMFDNHNLHKVWYYDLQTICTWTWRQTQSKLTQTSVLKMVCCTSFIHRSSAGRGAEYLQTGCPRSDPLRVFSLSALNELAWILTSQAGSALIGHRVIGEKGGGLRTEHKKCHVCFTAFLFFYYSLRNAYIYLSWPSAILLYKCPAVQVHKICSVEGDTAHKGRSKTGF